MLCCIHKNFCLWTWKWFSLCFHHVVSRSLYQLFLARKVKCFDDITVGVDISSPLYFLKKEKDKPIDKKIILLCFHLAPTVAAHCMLLHSSLIIAVYMESGII